MFGDVQTSLLLDKELCTTNFLNYALQFLKDGLRKRKSKVIALQQHMSHDDFLVDCYYTKVTWFYLSVMFEIQ